MEQTIKVLIIKRYIFILLAVSMICGHTYAHENMHIVKDFGNVKISIITGYEYEEINNVALLGQLAEKLAKKLKCSASIFLDFEHDYSNKGVTKSSVSHELQNKKIIVWQCSNHFDAQTTMKLLEYAILNYKKNPQLKHINYKRSTLNPIDSLELIKVISAPDSDLLSKIMKIRVDSDENMEYGISYYLQNNRYYVFQKGFYQQGLETILFDLEHIYDFKKTGETSALIFDTDSTFCYAEMSDVVNFNESRDTEKEAKISQRQTIDNREGYRPFMVKDIGGEKIAISFCILQNGKMAKTLIWAVKKEYWSI